MDDYTNFEYAWNRWIVPLIEDLYNQTDENFREKCNLEVRDLDRIYGEAEKYYQRKREEMKRMFYGKYHKGDSKTEHRMDFHKLSSLICRTLIEYKVYKFNEPACEKYVDENIKSYETDWVVKNALINYRLAFHASVVFMLRAMQFEYCDSNKELYELIQDKDKLDLYESCASNGDGKVKESFENCVILDLAKRDIGNRSFDYFMYAIIMYQLEEHNKKLLLNEKESD